MHGIPVAAMAGIQSTMIDAREVCARDLDYICNRLTEDFPLLEGKRLLITGGAGFLGYYLVQSVLHWNERRNHNGQIQLTVYDNYVRGVPSWLSEAKNDSNLTLVKHDVTQPLPDGMGDFQYIIHAASIASPTYYRRCPVETMDANVNGLRSLLEYFRGQREKNRAVEGFLFFSSSEIYGDPPPEHIPTPESYRGNVSCTGPRACYDEAKRYGETLCVNFAAQYGLPIRAVRPFNNYGPGLKITDRRVIPDFARDILADRDVVMLSDGSPRRTFCYVADAVVGYYKALIRGKDGEAYNIGVEAPEISVAEIAEHMVAIARAHFGYRGKIVRQVSSDLQYLADNPNRRCPAIAKAKTELDYRPSVSLKDGLTRSLIWYQSNRNAEDL
jgi:nucleoside-diphosphate-sugar epimerase